MTVPAVKTALLSVFDKTDLIPFAEGLAALGVQLLSTGGTAQALEKAGIAQTDVSAHTGFPEMLDGRVKTLHPHIHGGLLAKRGDAAHQDALKRHGIAPIDLVAVSLYPFEDLLEKGAPYEDLVEMIDIGGPAMIRSAAKNHRDVVVIVETADYAVVLEELQREGTVSLETKKRLAAKAFARTAAYDAVIAGWFLEQTAKPEDPLPSFFAIGGRRQEALRYGENPHQLGALYGTGETRSGVATATLVQGKALSYNNLNDSDAAFECVSEFDPARGAACVIVKHAGPCGVAVAQTPKLAYTRALAADPVSAFGGVVALNGEIDGETAEEISQIFTEVIIAPRFSQEALSIFSRKKNLRVLKTDGLALSAGHGLYAKTISGGLLVQSRDLHRLELGAMEVVTKRHPSPEEWDDLLFAMRVCKHVKSNAIVYARGEQTLGIGAGQMSRVVSCDIAALKARDLLSNAEDPRPMVVASDAFFPFTDGLESALKAGARAVIQPGGSIRDGEVIAAADAKDVAMIFTGIRHFRH